MTSHNLINVIIEDHNAVEGVFDELEHGDRDSTRRGELVQHVIAELVRHSVAEEQFMYPAVRAYVPGGDAMADHEIREHAEAERVMKDLEKLSPDDALFDEKLELLMGDIRHHVEHEENELLPQLQRHCTPEDLDELGARVQQAKEIAPTRPHPSAPDTPPANILTDAGLGLVDRIRDRLSSSSTS